MNNTMSKWEYIIENIVWSVILFMWCKSLFFRCVSNFTYMESFLILGVVLFCVIAIGIRVTWRYGRNYINLFENIVIAWGIFVFISYFDIYKERFLVVGVVTFVITILMTIPIFLRKIKRQDKRNRIIKNRIRKTIQCIRRNISVAVLVILVPLGISVLFRGTILNSKVEVTKVYGDEHCLDANIEVISNINPERWEKLDIQERLDVCQTILNCEARYLGLSHEISIGTQELPSETLGYYSETQHLVVININHLKYSESYEVLKTIIHEATHAYQHEQVAVYRTLDEKSRNLLLFYDASVYIEEFANYKDGEKDYWQYYGQKVEYDARKAAETESVEYIQRVNNYLQNKNE